MAQSKTNTKTRTDIHYPVLYNCIILNDDQTPIDFVIQMVVDIFNKNIAQAQTITMRVHEEGQAIVGTYSKEISEQKVLEATTMARYSGYPLKVVSEPA